MKYTKDNPKLVEDNVQPGEYNFTGVVKDKDGDMTYYEDGNFHRGDGPAVECANGDKEWHYNGKYYGYNDDFTIESWIKKWKLEVFK